MPGEENPPGIFRYALGIEYRGTFYCGWQRQDGLPEETGASVQLRVEQALSKIADEEVAIVCAGRTDSGVHACEQVVHFETRALRPDRAWLLGTNTHLPDDISVLWVKAVSTDFHARFSATARTYRYVINNSPRRPALSRELMTWVHRPLDHERMHRAAQYLLGEKDFSSFRGNSCQSKTPFRFVHHITVQRSGGLVVVEIKANAFLHHMVRNVVGALLKVGLGDETENWIDDVLAAKTRTAAGVTAAANGLYLLHVDYPSRFRLPQRTGPAEAGGGLFDGMLASDFC